MRLITPQHWAERHFDEGSRPAEATVRRWLATGQVPGRKVGGSWYVDEQAWQAGGDPLVEHALQALGVG